MQFMPEKKKVGAKSLTIKNHWQKYHNSKKKNWILIQINNELKE